LLVYFGGENNIPELKYAIDNKIVVIVVAGSE
jgi:hypothetical protein